MAKVWIKVLLMCSLSVAASVYAYSSCKSATYRGTNGRCQRCPDHCETCDSNTNCTECQHNYWGLTCHRECSQHCSDRCHKEFGHCIRGCPDGTFRRHGSAECITCASNCKVCSSLSNCFRCKPRFYGPDCQSCPNSCVDNKCNMITGKCYDCDEDYFSEDGICPKCPVGCASCYDGEHCTTCDDGFYGPYNRMCFPECRNTDTTSQFLISPDDRCGIPKGHVSHKAHACGKVSSDQAYTCATNRSCLINTTSSSDDNGSLNQVDDNNADACVTVMSEVCLTKCLPYQTGNQDDVKYLCSQTCKIKKAGLACFHENTTDSSKGTALGYRLNTIDVLCFPESDTGPTSFGDILNVFGGLIIVSSIGLAATCIGAILLISGYKSRQSSARAAKHSSHTNIEDVTSVLEEGNIPHIVHPVLQMHEVTNMGLTEVMQTTQCEEYDAELGILPLRNQTTVQDGERVRTDVSTGMTSLMNQPSVSREEYMTLGVDVEVHSYERLVIRDSNEDCGQFRPTSEGGVNSREATGTSCDYLTPLETLHNYRN